MVETDAWSRATWPSSATVTLSRKRRWTRVLTVRRNQVAVADRASPAAATSSSVRSPSMAPLPRRLIHSASRASGRAAARPRPNDPSIRPGSACQPSTSIRHMAAVAGGSSASGRAPVRSRKELTAHLLRRVVEPVGRLAVLTLAPAVVTVAEPAGLELEHRAVAAAPGHELVVAAQLDHPTGLQHTDAVGVAHGGEPVG